jgi:hypothetical protein
LPEGTPIYRKHNGSEQHEQEARDEYAAENRAEEKHCVQVIGAGQTKLMGEVPWGRMPFFSVTGAAQPQAAPSVQSFQYQADSWTMPRRVVANSNTTRASCSRASVSS